MIHLNIQINNSENIELIDLKQKKNDIYITLINDFIIELSAKFYEDFIIRLLKNMFNITDDMALNNEVQRLPFKDICDLLNRSKKLLNSHNENIKLILS